MLIDTIPFQLDFPPIFGVGLKLDRDTVTATSGFAYVEGRLYGSGTRFSAKVNLLSGDGKSPEDTSFGSTWVSDPMPGRPIDRNYGFKAYGSTPPGKYRFRITIWNATGDTIRPEFPFVVVKP